MSDKKQTFVSKVLDFIQGGDEAKVKRFHKKLVKSWNDQIKLRQDNIENYQEEIVDLKESLEESVYNVDVTRIQTTQDTTAYIEEYSQKLYKIEGEISEKEESITEAEEEIAGFQALIKLVN